MASTAVDASSEVWASARRQPAAYPDARAQADLADLFVEHRRLVLGVCRTLLRNREEAEDAAQQTFLSAYRSLLGGGRPRQPAAWLAAIARNECSARIRRRMREPLAGPGIDVGQADHVPDLVRSTELWEAVGSLPVQQQRALILRELGFTYEEVANELEISEPAVESLLFRARTKLRGALASVSPWPLEAGRHLLFGSVASKVVAGGVAVTIAAGGTAVLTRDSRGPATVSVPEVQRTVVHRTRALPSSPPRALPGVSVPTPVAPARRRSPGFALPVARAPARTPRVVSTPAPKPATIVPMPVQVGPEATDTPDEGPPVSEPAPATPAAPAPATATPTVPVGTQDPAAAPPPQDSTPAAPEEDPHSPHNPHGLPPVDNPQPAPSTPTPPAHAHGVDPKHHGT